jgi:hypothetical protein
MQGATCILWANLTPSSLKLVVTDSTTRRYWTEEMTQSLLAGALLVSDAPSENRRAFRQFCVEVCTSFCTVPKPKGLPSGHRPVLLSPQVDRRLMFGPRPGELEVLLEQWLHQPTELLRRAADGQQWARASKKRSFF